MTVFYAMMLERAHLFPAELLANVIGMHAVNRMTRHFTFMPAIQAEIAR